MHSMVWYYLALLDLTFFFPQKLWHPWVPSRITGHETFPLISSDCSTVYKAARRQQHLYLNGFVSTLTEVLLTFTDLYLLIILKLIHTKHSRGPMGATIFLLCLLSTLLIWALQWCNLTASLAVAFYFLLMLFQLVCFFPLNCFTVWWMPNKLKKMTVIDFYI